MLFVHRPEYYRALTKQDRVEVAGVEYATEGLAEVIIAKNRNGETGSAALHFEKEFPRFCNFETSAPGGDPGYYGEARGLDEKPF